MRSTVLSLSLVLLLVSAGSYVFAQEKTSTEATATEAATTEAVEVGNTLCPVSGEKVGQMGDVVQYEYNGKIYNFCCPACVKDFKKDPEKYSKIAEDEVKAREEENAKQETMEHDHSGHEHK